ncbi:hypothetical protein JKP88DRAFT_322344 [Tribonema minus]|uniref:Leucine-rich repeat domain-containing protein n=1 Tax=Tribonema minus TaxID=303371 RepID=A0A835YTU1_9STRA|nr:hypothetical protein JKP88DRAFT_322344 [Tribonema minus]
MLPAGLRVLDLWGDFDQPLGDLPPDLHVLQLGAYEHPLPQLPDTLETLVLDGCTCHIAALPASLRSLSVYWQPPFHAPRLPLRAAAWPARLERLVYWAKTESGSARLTSIEHLPPTLTQVELNGCEVHARLPHELREVRLGRAFRQALDLTLSGAARVVVNEDRFVYA